MANVFDLFAKINLDDSAFKDGLSRVGKTLGTFAKTAGAALAAGATGVAALTKQAVNAYGEYEQLTGGIKKLYGNMGMSLEEYAENQGKSIDEIKDKWESLEESQNIVLKNAQDAYKNSGLSMNQYMETATQFSASLISSLGGDSVEAAKLTDVAMTAISDNWNTFGGDLEAISNAFKGFSKQNFNMLDNLKLGYGGTKVEMERLIADANEYAKTIGEASDLSIESFGDMIKAIDLIQKKQQIYGTTQREAATTIQGSLNMTKAAWENLLTGLGDSEADLNSLMDNVVKSAETTFDNIVPVAEKAILAIGSGISRLAPKVAEELPGLITELLPDLISAGWSLVEGIGNGVVNAFPALLESAEILLNTVLENLGIKDVVDEFVGEIAGPFSEAWETIKTSATDAFERIEEAISPVIDAISEYVGSGQLMEDATNFLSEAVGLLADGFSRVADFVATIVEKGREFIDWLNGGSAGAEAFKTVVIALTAALGAYKAVTLAIEIAQKAQLLATQGLAAAQKILNAVMNANPIGLIIAGITALVAAFIYLWNTSDEFREFWINLWENIKEFASDAWEGIKNVFNAVGTWFTEKFTAAKEGIMEAWGNIKEKFSEKWEGIKSAFSTVGDWFSEKFGEAKENAVSAWDNIKEKASEIWSLFKDGFSIDDALNWGKDMIENFISGITQKWEALKSSISDIGQVIKDFLGFSEPKKGPLSNFHTYAPDMMKLFAEGIKENEHIVSDQINKSFDFGEKTLSAPSRNANLGGAYQAYSTRQIIGFDIDEEGLVRYLRPYIKNEDLRIGEAMVT